RSRPSTPHLRATAVVPPVTVDGAGLALRTRYWAARAHRAGPGEGRSESGGQRVVVRPPSMVKFAPVMLAARSDARYTTRPATSPGRVKRPVTLSAGALLGAD